MGDLNRKTRLQLLEQTLAIRHDLHIFSSDNSIWFYHAKQKIIWCDNEDKIKEMIIEVLNVISRIREWKAKKKHNATSYKPFRWTSTKLFLDCAVFSISAKTLVSSCCCINRAQELFKWVKCVQCRNQVCVNNISIKLQLWKLQLCNHCLSKSGVKAKLLVKHIN